MHTTVFYDQPGKDMQTDTAVSVGNSNLPWFKKQQQEEREAAQKVATQKYCEKALKSYKASQRKIDAPRGYQSVNSFAQGINIPSGTLLRRSRYVRDDFSLALSTAATNVVKRIALRANSKAARLACHELAASRGFCYLRMVTMSQAACLLKAVKWANARLGSVVKAIYKNRLKMPKFGRRLTPSGCLPNGKWLYHVTFERGPVNYDRETLEWASEVHVGATLEEQFLLLEHTTTTGSVRYSLANGLSSWLNDASVQNIAYLAVRTRLFDALERLMIPAPVEPAMFIDWQNTFWHGKLQQIRSFLMSRRAGGRATQRGDERGDASFADVSSDSMLAFNVAINDCLKALENKTQILIRRHDGEVLSIDSVELPRDSILAFIRGQITAVDALRGLTRPGIEIHASLNPNPTDLQQFLRTGGAYTRDNLTGVPSTGAHQRIEQIRTDVRFIEDKLEKMWPVIMALQGTTPPGGSTSNNGGSGSVVFPSTMPSDGQIPNEPSNAPLGDGGFPMTIEGQIARILVNLRIYASNNGIRFQGDLVTVVPSVAIPNWSDMQGGIAYDCRIQYGGYVSTIRIITTSFGYLSLTTSIADLVTEIVRNVSGVELPGLPGTGGTSQQTKRIDVTVDRLMRNLGLLMDSTGVVQVQASLPPQGESTLQIADVTQVLEVSVDKVMADTPMEEQLNTIDEWTIKNVLSRPTLIAKKAWNSQARGTEIINVSFPNQWLDNLGRNKHFTNMLNSFSMMKADVVFKLDVNATQMYGGILAMGFDFYGRLHSSSPVTSEGNKILDLTTISNTDPVYLDISDSKAVEMTVPFSAVSQYLSRQHAPFASQFMGQLFVSSMSTLCRPTGAPDVEIKLYAYVESPAVAILQEPATTPFVVPQANIVKTITSFAHSFLPSMQDVYPLALDEGYHVVREQSCRVEQIGGVYGLVGSAQWSTSTADNTELFKVPVHPMAHQRMSVGINRAYQTTRIGHLARHYSYWNGTLEFKLEVACSMSHAGKLYIVFDSGPAYAGGDVIETNAHLLLDVQTKHELEFTVPFASPTPWKPTYMYQPFGDISTTCTGHIRVMSHAGIKSALMPNSDITVNLYMRCGKDFQLAVPRNGLQGNDRLGDAIAQVSLTSISPRLKMNSEDFNDIYKVLRRFTPLGTPVRTQSSEALVIPVRPLIPRNVVDNSVSVMTAGFAFWRGSISYKFKIIDMTTNRGAFEIFHIPTMGIPQDIGTNFSLWVPLNRVSGRASTGSFMGSQTFHGEIDKEWEVTVPYYSMYDHLHLPLTHYEGGDDQKAKLPLLSTNNGCLIVRPLFGEGDTSQRQYSLSISMSCGQDFTLLAPTSWPLIVPLQEDVLGTDVTVVAQASLEVDFDDELETQADEDEFGLPVLTPSTTNEDNTESQWKIIAFFQKLSRTVDRVDEISKVVEEHLQPTPTDSLSRILKDIVFDMLKEAKIHLSGWLTTVMPDVDWRLMISTMVAAIVIYKFRKDLSLASSFVLGSLSAIVSHQVITRLRDFVNLLDKDDSQISAQVGAGLDIPLIIQLCCGAIAVMLNMDFTRGISHFVKELGHLGRSLTGIKSGVESVRIFSQFIQDNVIPSLSSDDSLTLKGLMTDAVDILEEVYTLNLEEMRIACFTQQDIKQRVLKCDGRLQELNRLVLLNPCPSTIVNTLQKAMVRMDKLRTEVMQYKGEDGYRIDPFHISVYGPPKIGKSAMMNKLSDDLITYHGLPMTNKVYTRSPENVYWDNYKGQTTVMFDDLGQIAAQQPPSDLSELISLKSNAPYMVHMASLAEKGTYFTSTFIISSTNFKLYNDCSFVKSKEALHRRRDVLLEMQPHVVNAKDGLMPSDEFKRGLNGSDSYAKFRILNSITANPETEWLSYDEVVVMIAEKSATHLADQRALVERNQRGTSASPVIQAILSEREPTIPGVQVGKEFVVVDIDAQAQLDACVDQESKDKLLTRWKEHFKNAWYWRDYGALTSGFSPMSRSAIAGAIRKQSPEGLSPVERKIYSLWQSSKILQKRSAQALEQAREGIISVGMYFQDLWRSLPSQQRKYLSTALVSLGALAVGTVLYSLWSRRQDSQKSNIPKEIFVEGDEAYQSKQRSQPMRKQVKIESGIDDYKTMRGKHRIQIESGIDDFKTARGQRKIVIESARDFEEWSAKNPGMIPYKYQINDDESKKTGKLVFEENKLWSDFEEFCVEKGHTQKWRLPPSAPGYMGETLLTKVYDFFSSSKVKAESGIDDYKTHRGMRKIHVEGSEVNPMVLDVPEEIMTLSESDLLQAMQSIQMKGLSEPLETDMTVYESVNVKTQFTTDNQCVDLIQTKLADNVGFVFHEKSSYRMRCLVADDKFVLLPKHFFKLTAANWQRGDIFKLWIRGKLYEQSFHEKFLLCWPQRDMCVYLLSARVSGAKSIIKYIANRATHGSYRTTDGSLLSLSCERNGSMFFDRHHLPVISRMTEADHQRIQYGIGKATHILKGYSYSADTVNGDCGSVLLQHNVRQPQKILGLHVAAQSAITRSFAELLVQEEVIEKIAELKKQVNYIPTGSVLQTVELAKRHEVLVQGSISPKFQFLNSNVDILGSVPKALQKRAPAKTEILPSPIQGVIDLVAKTEPAALTVRDPRCHAGHDPLIETVGGYGLDSKPFLHQHFDIIREHQIQKLSKYDGFIDRRILSLNEAINGIEGVDYADAMNMHSAEGSFWNLSRPFWAHNKSWMFTNLAPEGERAHYKINYDSGLLQKVIHRLKEAMEGRRVLSVTSENTKDERRPLKKTRPAPDATAEEIANFTPNTRSFSIMPVDYNILVRQYFWDFAAMIMKNRGELGPQIGIDPCSIEWTALMKRLMSTSTKGFAGDYKNYDRQTPAEFMDLSCDIINGWYNDGPVHAQIRKVLMGEAYDRLSIVRDAYLHIDKGLPSGFPLTTIVNSLNNDTYKYCAWLSLAPVELMSLDKCDELTDSIYYGDDNAHAIDPTASSFFNMRTVGEFLAKHGVDLTDEHKNHWSKAESVVDIEGISFLKRLFVKHPENGLYLAPLEKRSIEDRLLWVTDSKYMSPDELLKENITNSLRDAFHWGPGYFLELKNKIDVAITKRYPEPSARRQMLSDVTYGGEELRWIQTCKYMDQMHCNPILKDVFGF